jgi:hypothetical protein
MKASEFINEGWSQKYKSSINCSHPKGFSQRAHCAGKKKHNESIETEMVCEDCGMCQTHGNLNEIRKGEKDSNGYTRCWPGKHAEGTKKGKNGGQVRNCVPNESIEESEGKRCRQCGMINCACPGNSCKCKPIKGWIPGKGFKKAMDESNVFTDARMNAIKAGKDTFKVSGKTYKVTGDTSDELEATFESLSLDEQFDMIEHMVEQLANAHGVDADVIWEEFESVDDHELLDESAAWHRKAGKNPKGGLNRKGVASYRAEHPGSHLQMAVTTKPSKLKPGSKAAKRRKSFCARMGGVKGPMKKPNGKPTRKALALRKWNC